MCTVSNCAFVSKESLKICSCASIPNQWDGLKKFLKVLKY